jgi:hypothetical protein
MNSATQPDSGYSPPITIELHLNGETFNVASSGPERLILRNPRAAAAGNGIVRFIVDGKVTDYRVNVPSGIDPGRTHQPVSNVEMQSEAAA